MSEGRFGIVDHPENADTAVILYDGEPVGTIMRRRDRGSGLQFTTWGLSVKGPDILDPDEHSAHFSGTSGDRFTPEEYATWKAALNL